MSGAVIRASGGLERQPTLAPRLHPAVERRRAQEAEIAQRRGRERRDLAELADRDDPRRRVGQLVVDAQLELTARQVTRAWNMTGRERVALAHVEHDDLAAARDARVEL